MRNCKNAISAFVIILLLVVLLIPVTDTYAQVVYENANGYEVAIDDDADLLTDDEETALLQVMQPITEYGNVAFKSVKDDTAYSTSSYADHYYQGLWGSESGTVFLIDMKNRMIYIHSVGTVYGTLKKSYANTITDNVYTYATNGDYVTCANEAYAQMYTVLEGGRIAQPMKYISNALFAFMLSFVLLYFFVKMLSRAKRPSRSQLFNSLDVTQSLDNVDIDYKSEERTYIAVRDSEFWLELVLKLALSILFGGAGGGSRGGGSRSGGSRGGGSRGGGGHRF